VILVAAPTKDKDKAESPSLKAVDPVKVGAGVSVSIQGSNLKELKGVSFNGSALKWQLAEDKKSVSVSLSDDVTQRAGTMQLDFEFAKSTHVEFPVIVFDQKIAIAQ
jgi:hypothetical protein